MDVDVEEEKCVKEREPGGRGAITELNKERRERRERGERRERRERRETRERDDWIAGVKETNNNVKSHKLD